jgi:hypothetical protein
LKNDQVRYLLEEYFGDQGRAHSLRVMLMVLSEVHEAMWGTAQVGISTPTGL